MAYFIQKEILVQKNKKIYLLLAFSLQLAPFPCDTNHSCEISSPYYILLLQT